MVLFAIAVAGLGLWRVGGRSFGCGIAEFVRARFDICLGRAFVRRFGGVLAGDFIGRELGRLSGRLLGAELVAELVVELGGRLRSLRHVAGRGGGL